MTRVPLLTYFHVNVVEAKKNAKKMQICILDNLRDMLVWVCLTLNVGVGVGTLAAL